MFIGKYTVIAGDEPYNLVFDEYGQLVAVENVEQTGG